MSKKIYCFSLMVSRKRENYVSVSSKPFIIYSETKVEAQEIADSYIKTAYPMNQGWDDHQVSSPLLIKKSKVLQIASAYKNEDYDVE